MSTVRKGHSREATSHAVLAHASRPPPHPHGNLIPACPPGVYLSRSPPLASHSSGLELSEVHPVYDTYYRRRNSCTRWRELQFICSVLLMVLASIALVLASPALLGETVRETLNALHTGNHFHLMPAGPKASPLHQTVRGVG